MRPVAKGGVAWYVCVSVCLLVTFVIPAKTAEPIEMPFGWVTRLNSEYPSFY